MHDFNLKSQARVLYLFVLKFLFVIITFSIIDKSEFMSFSFIKYLKEQKLKKKKRNLRVAFYRTFLLQQQDFTLSSEDTPHVLNTKQK